MTETYKNKTIAQIETEFDNLFNSVSKYQIAKTGAITEAMLSKYKNEKRKIAIEKKIEVLEKYYKVGE